MDPPSGVLRTLYSAMSRFGDATKFSTTNMPLTLAEEKVLALRGKYYILNSWYVCHADELVDLIYHTSNAIEGLRYVGIS